MTKPLPEEIGTTFYVVLASLRVSRIPPNERSNALEGGYSTTGYGTDTPT